MNQPARYPLTPLLALLHPDSPERRADAHRGVVDRTALLLADVCGVSVRTAFRYLAVGTLPWYHADRAACRLGLHPQLLWDDYRDAA